MTEMNITEMIREGYRNPAINHENHCQFNGKNAYYHNIIIIVVVVVIVLIIIDAMCAMFFLLFSPIDTCLHTAWSTPTRSTYISLVYTFKQRLHQPCLHLHTAVTSALSTPTHSVYLHTAFTSALSTHTHSVYVSLVYTFKQRLHRPCLHLHTAVTSALSTPSHSGYISLVYTQPGLHLHVAVTSALSRSLHSACYISTVHSIHTLLSVSHI